MNMREIKFRGKRLDNGAWMYGSLVILNGRHFIFDNADRHEVDPETIGQWTGLCDREKTKVYEGDIIAGSNGSINGYPWPFTLQIEWDAAACSFNTPKWLCMNRTHYYDVVGNVYDNPEKLK